MRKRQQGKDAEFMMRRAAMIGPKYASMVQKIVITAYAYPLYETREQRLAAPYEFDRLVYKQCLQKHAQ